MKYDFDNLSIRRNTNSIKWDVKENELPMWVADMDFLVFPEIKNAIIEAANKGAYGYSFPTENFFKAYQRWWKDRHQLVIDLETMVYVSGIVSSLDSMINHLTKPHDSILLLAPSYNGFYNVVNNNNRKLVTSKLKYANNDFVIDYQDVESKIVDNDVKLTIFCNPHNPTGKIWSKQEIADFYEICKKHHVLMISDEIHCDIVDPGYSYVPALSISKDIITCLAPSKVFNLAGLQSAVVVVYNQNLKEIIQKGFYRDDVGEPNYFMEPATIAAYTKGDEFVDELNKYLFRNKEFVKEFLKKEIPEIKVTSGHATYLLWLDISGLHIPCDEFVNRLKEETGLYICDGLIYGDESASFVRINIATSFENVKDALNRLNVFCKTYLVNK